MSRAVQLTPEQQALLDEAVSRRVERERRRHAATVEALQARLAEAHAEIAALRLQAEHLQAKHGGHWLRLLPAIFHRQTTGKPDA